MSAIDDARAVLAKGRSGRFDSLADATTSYYEALAALVVECEALQTAVDRAHGALTSSQYVGGPSERDAWRTATSALGEVVTQHVGAGFPSPEALELRHGGGARILNPDEDRSDADGAYALDPEAGVEGE